jgi:hypothetical protein
MDMGERGTRYIKTTEIGKWGRKPNKKLNLDVVNGSVRWKQLTSFRLVWEVFPSFELENGGRAVSGRTREIPSFFFFLIPWSVF